jgi:hypothetical protein
MGERGPDYKPINWDEFDKLVAYQCTQQEIADFFDVDIKTLDAACIRERGEKLSVVWDKKKKAGRVKLKKAQFRIAESNHPAAATMAIFLGKALLNQSDQPIDKEILETIQNLGISRDEALDILRGAAERQLAKDKKKTFSEFCEKAGYPLPFDKQVEMVQFGMGESVPRLLLGAVATARPTMW